MMTVSNYMLYEWKDMTEYLCHNDLFLHDKSQQTYRIRKIKHQCIELFSSLIEIFSDQAIFSILEIIKSLMVKTKDNEELSQFKRLDVAMLLLGIFVEDI